MLGRTSNEPGWLARHHLLVLLSCQMYGSAKVTGYIVLTCALLQHTVSGRQAHLASTSSRLVTSTWTVLA